MLGSQIRISLENVPGLTQRGDLPQTDQYSPTLPCTALHMTVHCHTRARKDQLQKMGRPGQRRPGQQLILNVTDRLVRFAAISATLTLCPLTVPSIQVTNEFQTPETLRSRKCFFRPELQCIRCESFTYKLATASSINGLHKFKLLTSISRTFAIKSICL